MKIHLHSYQLTAGENVRAGVLMRVEWAPRCFGYSDLHPWPEFGDEPLEAQIARLADSDTTPLLRRSLELNSIDYNFRKKNRSAFLGLALPSVHKLIRPGESCEGFTHAKVKMGRDLGAETKTVLKLVRETSVKLRLDFNNRLSGEEFLNWWSDLSSEVRARIDFVEDPGEVKSEGPWAADWQNVPFARVKVIKPAREDASLAAGYKRVVFTHSLDHSFGMAASLWAAADYYREHPSKAEVCGLGASGYEPDEFSREWNCPGPKIKPPPGTGFGFDEILAGLKWDRVL